MGVEPLAPSWPPLLMGSLLLLGTPPRKQMLTLENLMRQAVRTKETKGMSMPSLWARRLAEDEVVELDVVESVMPEDVVVNRIYEADPAEDRMAMSKAMSKSCRVARVDRCDDDTSAVVAPMVSRMSMGLM